MARQGYNVNTSDKKLEVFSSFGGGMVTQSHPEKLRDDESVLIENANILAGGALESRWAYSRINNSPIVGTIQGRFRYEDINTGGKDIVAIDGSLYIVVGDIYTKLPITNLTEFQKTRPIHAVQFRDKLYIATGSGLVTYDGTTATLLPAYVPNGLEYLYIGSNGYAVSPDTAITDIVATGIAVLAVVPSIRYGMVNTPVTFTAYHQKPAADTLEYQFEVGKKDAGLTGYVVEQVWGTSKVFTRTFSEAVEYMIRVSVRKSGTTPVLGQYVLPSYKVNTVPDPKPEPTVNFSNLSTCNKLFIHYDRLFLYGDTTNPDQIYPSHLSKFDYFPRTNIIKAVDPLRGQLHKVVQYKNFLVCLTSGSLQMITGTNPQEFTIHPIHASLGTKHGGSVQVMKNFVVFVGNDNGLYVLKSFNFSSSDKLNVERIDAANQDVLVSDVAACTDMKSTIHNNQYYLYMEINGTYRVYRHYFEQGTWVRDIIPMALGTLHSVSNTLVATTKANGHFIQLKKDSVLDDVNSQYVMKVLSKNFNFGAPHHRKKLKQFQLVAKVGFASTVMVTLHADDNELTTVPLIYDYTQTSDTQKLKVMASARFRTIHMGISVLVKESIQLIGFGFIFKENTPK